MATSRPTIGHEFWEGRYQAGRTGWERGVPTPAFRRLLASDRAPVPGRVVVPGCGRGHDALLFADDSAVASRVIQFNCEYSQRVAACGSGECFKCAKGDQRDIAVQNQGGLIIIEKGCCLHHGVTGTQLRFLQHEMQIV